LAEEGDSLDDLPVARASAVSTIGNEERYSMCKSPLFIKAAELLDKALTSDEVKENPKNVIQAYLDCAESFFKLKCIEDDGNRKHNSLILEKKISDICDRVEDLRKPPSTATTENDPPPVSNATSTHLSRDEIAVLAANSRIGNKIFQPFLYEEIRKFPFTTFGNAPFEDPDGLIPLR